MRRHLSIAAVVLLLCVTGCSGDDHKDEHASSKLTVFLTPGATADQRDALRRELTTLPEVTSVTFVDKQAAYARYKEQFKDAPDLLAAVQPDSLPESFEGTVSDGAFAEAVATVLHAEPGVNTTIISPTTLRVAHGVVVEVTGRDPAMESAINGLAQAKSVTFESADAALTRLKKVCHADRALADALTKDTVTASYRFVWTETKATAGEPTLSLSKLNHGLGVQTIPVSLL